MILEDRKQKMLGTHEELIKNGFDANEILKNYTASLKDTADKQEDKIQTDKLDEQSDQ